MRGVGAPCAGGGGEEGLVEFLRAAALVVEEELEGAAASRAWAGWRGWADTQEEVGRL